MINALLAFSVLYVGQSEFSANVYRIEDIAQKFSSGDRQILVGKDVAGSAFVLNLRSRPGDGNLDLLLRSTGMELRRFEGTNRYELHYTADLLQRERAWFGAVLQVVQGKMAGLLESQLQTNRESMANGGSNPGADAQDAFDLLALSTLKREHLKVKAAPLAADGTSVLIYNPQALDQKALHLYITKNMQAGTPVQPTIACLGLTFGFIRGTVCLAPFFELYDAGRRDNELGSIWKSSPTFQVRLSEAYELPMDQLPTMLFKGAKPILGSTAQAWYTQAATKSADIYNRRKADLDELDKLYRDSSTLEATQLIQKWASSTGKEVVAPLWPIVEAGGLQAVSANSLELAKGKTGAWLFDEDAGVLVWKNALAFLERPRRTPASSLLQALQQSEAPKEEGLSEAFVRRYFAALDKDRNTNRWFQVYERTFKYRAVDLLPLVRSEPLLRIWCSLSEADRNRMKKATLAKPVLIPISSLPSELVNTIVSRIGAFPAMGLAQSRQCKQALLSTSLVGYAEQEDQSYRLNLSFDTTKLPPPFRVFSFYSANLSLDEATTSP